MADSFSTEELSAVVSYKIVGRLPIVESRGMLRFNDILMKDFKKSYNTGSKFGSRPSFGAKPQFSNTGESHRTNCSECGASCEVPFIPNGKKPVYCRNCYKHKDAGNSSFTGQPFTRSVESHQTSDSSFELKKQFGVLNAKLDRLLAIVEGQ